jgi:hypothetical protein
MTGLGMWFRDDLANMLQAIALAGLHAGTPEYQSGFHAALLAVALAFGIPVPNAQLLAMGLAER